MKYLVIGNQAIMASEHKAQMDFLLRTKEWVNTKLADGTLDCAYSFPAGGGFFIFNADSNEGLTKLLVDFLICLLNGQPVNLSNSLRNLK